MRTLRREDQGVHGEERNAAGGHVGAGVCGEDMARRLERGFVADHLEFSEEAARGRCRRGVAGRLQQPGVG